MPTHLIEPELCGPTPRFVRESSGHARLLRFLARSALFLFCLACYFASYRLREANDWLRHQQAVSAQVLDREDTSHGDTPEYCLHYSFQSMHGVVNDGIVVDDETFNQYDSGDAITLFHRSDAPTQWRVTPESEATVSQLQTSLICAITIGASVVLIGLCSLRAYQIKRLRFLREGEAVVATVIKESGKAADFSSLSTLTYQWQTSKGKSRRKTVVVTNDMQKRYPEGAQFTVLCDPLDTYNSVPYFLATEGEIKGKYDGPQPPVFP